MREMEPGKAGTPTYEGLVERFVPLGAGLLASAPHIGIVLGREEFYYGDHFRFSSPLAAIVAEAFRNHHLPLWNPWVLTGTPLVAERGGLVAHPGLLLALVMQPSHAIGVLMVALLFVLAAGSTALLRALSVRTPLAVCVGAAIGLSGPAISSTSTAPLLATLAFLPMVLVCAVRMAQGNRAWLQGGLALGMALLGGDLPGALIIALAALCVFLAAGGRLGRAWPSLLALGGIGLLVGVGSWLPILWGLPLSERGAGIVAEEAGQWSFHPGELLGFLWPHPLGLPLPRFTLWPLRWIGHGRLLVHSVWMGALVAVAAFAGLRRPGMARALSLLALVLLVGATGASTPLWVILRPLFTFVRYPSKLVLPAAVILALAGAVSLEDMLSRPRGVRSVRNLGLWVLGVAGVGAGVGPHLQAWLGSRVGAEPSILAAAGSVLRADTLRVAVLALVVVVLCHLVLRGRLSLGRSVPLLAGLILVDVFATTADLVWTRPWHGSPRPTFLGKDSGRGPRVIRLEEISKERLPMNERAYSEEQLRQAALLLPLTNLPHHVGVLDPYGLYLSDVAQAMSELASSNPLALAEVAACDLMLAGRESRAPWLVSAEEQGRLVPAAVLAAGARVLHVPNALPRSFLTGAALLLPRAEIPRRLAQNSDRILLSADRALVAGKLASMNASTVPASIIEAAPTAPSPVSPQRWRPGLADYQVAVESPALFVEMEAFAPGWRVYVDGQEQTILQADVLGRGVVVPAGRHTVSWRFAPRLLEAAFVTSWVSLAIGMLVLGLARGRRSSPG